MAAPAPGNFMPKEPVQLNPPKDDPITLEELAAADGRDAGKVYVAIKGTVFDVTGNKSYLPGASYNVFAGKDGSRGLAMSSTKPEDATSNLDGLTDQQLKVLDDWYTFFSNRYNIVGKVVAN
ncbi:cytochrome b5-like heme/steroid binding domain-containing protein [Pyronema omphalodes]|nr:cytochrome b5-like heme/steroid binding domain-containing protein [Pyronema omphalodes]